MTTLAGYCINLDRRTDRWTECEGNRASQGLPSDLVQRWKASEEHEFGALGCARSHVAVLSNFLTDRTESHCMVLEDDFDFLRSWPDFANSFNSFIKNNFDWDVLLLAGTYTVAYAENPPGLARVVDSQTTSGYLVQRRYVPMLLQCFSMSIVQLEQFRSHKPTEPWTMRFAVDQAWKHLQRTDRWFIMTPVVGHQRASFSDIEQRTVDYASSTYRGTSQGQ